MSSVVTDLQNQFRAMVGSQREAAQTLLDKTASEIEQLNAEFDASFSKLQTGIARACTKLSDGRPILIPELEMLQKFAEINSFDPVTLPTGISLDDDGRVVGLRFQFSNITDIGTLSGLGKLAKLDLSRNQITDLSTLAECTGLVDLRLMGNQIEDISALSGLLGLKILYLGYNRITDISPVATLEKLEALGTYDNPLSAPSRQLLARLKRKGIDVDIKG